MVRIVVRDYKSIVTDMCVPQINSMKKVVSKVLNTWLSFNHIRCTLNCDCVLCTLNFLVINTGSD